ncbi:MAG: DUF4013 domain-containing protein [Coriobacteriales bacterium]|nr:DUF4013 domain-containing protein [Coriobacteriales bacterium]
MEDKRYFSKAWALLTRDKGWFKPLLVMTVAAFVPVAGWLGISGYGLEWARLTAWNIDSAPKQKNVAVGTCIASGWRGFVVSLGLSLGLGLLLGIIAGFFSVIPGAFGRLIQAIVSLASLVVYAVLGPALQIAEIRAAIYERISAGYRLKNLFEMIKRDKSGFFKLVLIFFCSTLIAGVASCILSVLVVIPLAPALYAIATHDSYLLIMSLSQTIVLLVLVFIAVIFALTFLQCGIYLITITATALWMRQFDVASWGRSEDPLPNTTVREQSAPMQPGQDTRETQRDYVDQEPVAASPYQEPQYLAPASEELPEQSQPAEIETPAPQPVAEPVAQPTVEPAAEPVEVPVVEQSEEPAEVSDESPTIRLRDRDEADVALDVPDKDVDELYADLYEVIHDNDHSGSSGDEE